MAFVYADVNRAQRERLRDLVSRLSGDDLRRTVEHGWTVAQVLAHIAFWDRHRLLLLKLWQREGQFPPGPEADLVNDAVAFLAAALPPHAAAELAVEAAEALDRELELLAPEQVSAIQAAGMERLLNRSLHREDHLDQIEQVFG